MYERRPRSFAATVGLGMEMEGDGGKRRKGREEQESNVNTGTISTTIKAAAALASPEANIHPMANDTTFQNGSMVLMGALAVARDPELQELEERCATCA